MLLEPDDDTWWDTDQVSAHWAPVNPTDPNDSSVIDLTAPWWMTVGTIVRHQQTGQMATLCAREDIALFHLRPLGASAKSANAGKFQRAKEELMLHWEPVPQTNMVRRSDGRACVALWLGDGRWAVYDAAGVGEERHLNKWAEAPDHKVRDDFSAIELDQYFEQVPP